MTISVIIPTWNEEANIEKLLSHLEAIKTPEVKEIIVVDGGSTDKTVEIAQKFIEKTASNLMKTVISPQKGRANQMNYGAEIATGDILQFIHADTIPPKCNFEKVLQAVKDGYPVGCFTYRFDSWHPLLVINGFFTRFDKLWCRGGDQAIFVTREVFEEVGRYRSDYIIMEDFDFIEKVQAKYPFKIIKKNCTVSARKYRNNPYMQVQLANLKVFNMYKNGASQQEMAETYKRLLKSHE